MDFRKLDKATQKNPYLLPFFYEVLNTIAGYEAYSFSDGYSCYHQIFIACEDRCETTFVTNWGAFVWMVMPFGVKNGPPSFQITVSKAFKENLDQSMKMFLDDFTFYNDMESHLMKLKLCFQKCTEHRINLNRNKCAFMVFLGLILRFIISKEGKVLDPKKVQAIVNMLVLTNPQKIQVFNGMAEFYRCFIKNFAFLMAPITKLMKKT